MIKMKTINSSVIILVMLIAFTIIIVFFQGLSMSVIIDEIQKNQPQCECSSVHKEYEDCERRINGLLDEHLRLHMIIKHRDSIIRVADKVIVVADSIRKAEHERVNELRNNRLKQ